MNLMHLMHDLYVDCKGCVNCEKSSASVHWKLEIITNLHSPSLAFIHLHDLHVTTITVISVISRISSTGQDSRVPVLLKAITCFISDSRKAKGR